MREATPFEDREFERLWVSFQPRLNTIAFRFCPSRADREDLISETFYRAWRRRDTCDRTKFEAWICAVLTSAFLDRRKRLGRRISEVRLDDDVQIQREKLAFTVPELELRWTVITDAIQALPQDDRSMVLMWGEDEDVTDIAEAFGISYRQATSRLHRLRKKVRDLAIARAA